MNENKNKMFDFITNVRQMTLQFSIFLNFLVNITFSEENAILKNEMNPLYESITKQKTKHNDSEIPIHKPSNNQDTRFIKA